MLLTLQNIGKRYGDATILEGLNLTLDRGQSVAVVAPSGAGKSTLLSIAGLLLKPSTGRVLIDDVDVTDLDDAAVSNMRCSTIGFLFQHTHLMGSLRAIENVGISADFVPAGQRMSAKQIRTQAEEMLTGLGLAERMYHFPSQLSNGQKRRVATARALFLHPQLIIADEPTNDLDTANAHNVVEALFARVEAGAAGLLFATHDLALAQRADSILELV